MTRIDWSQAQETKGAAEVADIEFVPHEIPLGGGTLALAPMPGRTRHYPADWVRLREWAPDLVISLTEAPEMARKGAGTLGADLGQAGIAWMHLPVRDFAVPEGLDWDAIRDDILTRLGQRQRILVHCIGGCGRSGMLCLRLMIAAGEAPEVALARLRKVRPCAVETDAQMAWAMQERA